MERVPYIDQSGLYAMEDLVLRLKQARCKSIACDLTQQPRMMMEKIDLIPELISDLEIFKDFKQAMVYIQANKNSPIN